MMRLLEYYNDGEISVWHNLLKNSRPLYCTKPKFKVIKVLIAEKKAPTQLFFEIWTL